jgi:Flp pilus assembly protein TadG
MLRRMRSWWADRSGAGAVEFVLVLPACVFLTIGAINLSILLFAVANLNNSVDDAARWASIQTTLNGTAPTSTAVTTYADGRYKGPGLTRTYVYTAAASGTCGHQVSVTATFKVITGIYNPTVPITATSCFS